MFPGSYGSGKMFKTGKMKDGLKRAVKILFYAAAGAVSGLALNLIIMHSPLPEMFPYYSEKVMENVLSVDMVSGIFLYCVAGPVLEEILFRRIVYDLLYRYTGFAAAAVISSFLFAAYHMNMIQGIYAFIMGMFFCAMYHRDHEIYVPVALHIGANLAVWLFSNMGV